MSQPVSENRETGRRWNGFVCPDCRLVFRVPQNHDGSGLVCPECRRLLRLPGPEDETPPLSPPGTLKSAPAEAKRPAAASGSAPGSESTPGTEPRRRVRKRRSHHKHKEQDLTWEHGETGPTRQRRGDRTRMRQALFGGGALLLLTLAFVIWQLNQSRPQQTTVPTPTADTAADVKTGTENQDAKPQQPEIRIADAETVARKFLDATTVAELAKTVRNPELAVERMRVAYPDGTLKAPGMAEFNCGGVPEREAGAYVFLIRTADYEMKLLNIVSTPAGPRVDWESWIGWCETPWQDFLDAKPPQPNVCRVIIREAKYYNYAFADDSKWRCYMLEPLDSGSFIYGYVERDSPTEGKMHLNPDLDGEMVMARIRFPEDSPGANQVLIEDLIQHGWITPDPGTSGGPEQP